MFNWEYLNGKGEVSFVHGQTLTFDIKQVIIDPYGRPVALEVEPATIINWNQIVAVKKL